MTRQQVTRSTRTTHEILTEIRRSEGKQLATIGSILHHPRSLARPMANWRPPLAHLKVGKHRMLTAAISRYRVGRLVQSRVRGYGEQRTPAYVVSIRITDPTGTAPPIPLAEAWIRAVVPENLISAVHQISADHETARIYAWLVDANYVPVHSPASIFAGFSQAA